MAGLLTSTPLLGSRDPGGGTRAGEEQLDGVPEGVRGIIGSGVEKEGDWKEATW